MKWARYLPAAVILIMAGPSAAVTITDDFASLGTIYQDGSGQLTNTFAAGDTNVTTNFEADATYVSSIVGNAVGVNWNETISFTLANLGLVVVSDSTVTSLNASNLPATSSIRINNTDTKIFVDPTPSDNSEFLMTSKSTPLGGGQVNVSRIGNAISGGPADGKWDLVSLFAHEIEHSIAYTTAIPKFEALAGSTGSSNRNIVVPFSLSGLPSDYDLPITSGGSHIDGTFNGGEFNDTVIADPGFDDSQRALLTAAEIEGACTVDGCTLAQMNTDPYDAKGSATPLPPAGAMLCLALATLWGSCFIRRRAS